MCLLCGNHLPLRRLLRPDIHGGRSQDDPTLCESCGDTKDEEIVQERLDAAKEAAQEAFDAILDPDDLAVIAKALAALKHLQPK